MAGTWSLARPNPSPFCRMLLPWPQSTVGPAVRWSSQPRLPGVGLDGYGPTVLEPNSFVLRSEREGLGNRPSSRRKGTVRLPRCSQLLESWASASLIWEAHRVLPRSSMSLWCQPTLVPNPEEEAPSCKNSKGSLIYCSFFFFLIFIWLCWTWLQ